MPRVTPPHRLALAGILGGGLALLGSSAGPPASHTGVPPLGGFGGEPTCAKSLCHIGNPVNQGGALHLLGLPEAYTPGATYPVTVRLESSSQTSFTRRWGFELTAVRLEDGMGAGTFSAPGLRVVPSGTASQRVYVTHQSDDLFQGQAGPVEWSFSWTAPGADAGPIGFFAAGNAANGNLTPSGDFIYTGRDTLASDPVPAAPITWGTLKRRWTTPSP